MSAETAVSSQLRAFIERAERLDEEIATLNADKRDLFAEAKGVGFDVKALKAVLGIRRKDPGERSEHNTLVALYLSTLGMADAADEVEQNDPRAHIQVQAHPRVREGDEAPRGDQGDGVAVATAPPSQSVEKVAPDVTGEGDGPTPAAGPDATPSAADGSNSRESASGRSVDDLPRTARDGSTGGDGGRDRTGDTCPDAAGGAPLAIGSGVTVGGDESGTAATVSRDGASEMVGGFPVPATPSSRGGTGSERPECAGVTAGERPGTLSAEREAAIAALRARQRNKPLDPRLPGFALAFRARHLRDPDGEEWTTGLPADAAQVAA